jgi:hypothetical protein
LFMIPQHDPPKLEGDFSKETVTFVQEEKVAGIVAAVGIPLTVFLLIILQILGKKIHMNLLMKVMMKVLIKVLM